MTHVDRSAWTFDDTIFKNYKEGLVKSEKYLDKLIYILRRNNIEINFILYPHPSQIVYKDIYHEPYWIDWAKNNNISLISMYSDFDGEDKREIALGRLSLVTYTGINWVQK